MVLPQLGSKCDGSEVSKNRCDDVAVLALADYYASLSMFNIKDEAVAWQEAVNLGKQIMTVVAL